MPFSKTKAILDDPGRLSLKTALLSTERTTNERETHEHENETGTGFEHQEEEEESHDEEEKMETNIHVEMGVLSSKQKLIDIHEAFEGVTPGGGPVNLDAIDLAESGLQNCSSLLFVDKPARGKRDRFFGGVGSDTQKRAVLWPSSDSSVSSASEAKVEHLGVVVVSKPKGKGKDKTTDDDDLHGERSVLMSSRGDDRARLISNVSSSSGLTMGSSASPRRFTTTSSIASPARSHYSQLSPPHTAIVGSATPSLGIEGFVTPKGYRKGRQNAKALTEENDVFVE